MALLFQVNAPTEVLWVRQVLWPNIDRPVCALHSTESMNINSLNVRGCTTKQKPSKASAGGGVVAVTSHVM